MLGITPLILFDMSRKNPVFMIDPVLFKPGDRIEFVSIDKEQFEGISQNINEYPYEIVAGETIEIRI